MVFWEITLATAYFLGLKRTYKLALRIQRTVVSPNHPKIRQFLQRRTRTIFDIALKVHHNIQERDIEVGRNLGNWILRWLDRMKPSAQIRGPAPTNSLGSNNIGLSKSKQLPNASNLKPPWLSKKNSNRHLSTIMLRKPFPTMEMLMSPQKPASSTNQYRHFSDSSSLGFYGSNFSKSCSVVIRKDIMQWMLQK